MKLTTSLFDEGAPPPCPFDFNAAAYCLSASANAHPNKTALIVVSDPQSLEPTERWTFAQLDDAVRRIAAGLTHMGLKPGERVMLRLGNYSSFPLIFSPPSPPVASRFRPHRNCPPMKPILLLKIAVHALSALLPISSLLMCLRVAHSFWTVTSVI